MDWESGDELCGRALPNLGGCQTRHGKHLKVNYKINIELKTIQTTLNTIKMRLQKEMKNKNVIIHHLKTASNQQSTLI